MSVSRGGRRGRAWVRGIALATATAVLPSFGCSFVFLDRPRDDYKPHEKIDCTTSYVLPNVDLALALAHIASIAILAAASGDSFGGAKTRQTLAQGDIFWMIMNGTSAGWGYYKVGQCRDLVAEEEGVPMRPLRVAPRPRPRPIEAAPDAQPADAPGPAPRANPSLPPPADESAPAPRLEAPRVPQKTDQD
jgi:hypothetical protein